MKINHIIIHELHKESGVVGSKLNDYDEVIDHNDQRVVKLVTEINNRYKNRNEIYGIFDKENPTVFHTSFDSYFKDNLGVDEFIKFSKDAAKDLQIRIDSNAPARGGYIIFVNYEAMRKFVGIFLVRNTLGLSFNTKGKGKKVFNIDDVQHIDFEHLAMACRLNTEAYSKTESKYLSFINSKSDDMSKYFTRWISSSDTETNQADTSLFYEIMNGIDIAVDPETGEKYEKMDFLHKVYDYVQKSPDKLVNVRNISESFYGDPNYIKTFLDDNDIRINGEFKPHSTTFRKFIHVKVKADNVELSFPNDAYKKIVTIAGNQIIIESEKLVAAVKETIRNNEE